MLSIKLIWSTDPNGYIGYKDGLLFKCKKDLQMFKEITVGNYCNAVVMGRKTFESIGSKPLPDRLNIVLSKDENFEFNSELGDKLQELHLSRNIRSVIEVCEEHNIEHLWVIGGKEIYEQFIELADEIVVTYFNQYSLFDPEEYVQFLPDLSQFKEYFNEVYSDKDELSNKEVTFNIVNYWRKL